jgi:hypothetical protein
MLSLQSTYALTFCATGALVLAVSHYQIKQPHIGKVPLVSPRGKHVIGLLCIIIGALIFAAQLMLRR